MPRVKLILLSLFAAFSLSAVASAAASAEVCSHGTKKGEVEFCVGGQEVESPMKMSDVVMENAAKLESEIGTTKVTIECAKIAVNHEKVTLEDSGASKGSIEFTNCSLIGAPNCTVANIAFEFKDQLVGAGGRWEDEFKPATGTTFVTIHITGATCAVKGALAVKGTQKCEADKNNTEAAEERNSSLEHDTEPAFWHKLFCKPAGSSLKLGTKEAKFTSTFALEGPETDLAWSIKESE